MRTIVACLCLTVFLACHSHAAEVPVPVPRPVPPAPPAELPEQVREERERTETVAPEDLRMEGQIVPIFDETEAKACEARLAGSGVRFEVGEAIEGEPPCGLRRPLKISGFGENVNARGAPTLNCAMVEALNGWVTRVVAPSARIHLGTALEAVSFSTSYQCRRRNNAASGKLSEHAFGNGVDVAEFHFADGRRVAVEVSGSERDVKVAAFQAAARGGACAFFTTVLGPGSNEAHAGHFHIDLAIRKGGYRLCE